jgi:pimeloyl-ACP methyl ester carboxylesterase
MTASMMHGMVQPMSAACDRAVYADPAFDAAYRRALDEGFSQGPDGYARDTVLASRPWPFDPSTIAVPVDLWYGREDSSPVHSPDLGVSLARRIPGSRHTVVDRIGGAVLWTHAREILEALLAR